MQKVTVENLYMFLMMAKQNLIGTIIFFLQHQVKVYSPHLLSHGPFLIHCLQMNISNTGIS